MMIFLLGFAFFASSLKANNIADNEIRNSHEFQRLSERDKEYILSAAASLDNGLRKSLSSCELSNNKERCIEAAEANWRLGLQQILTEMRLRSQG